MLSILESAEGQGTIPRGLLPVGGASIARHQLALALALGCQKIVALARSLSPGMLALQHEAERAGARFHAISGIRQFAGLVTADDELVVLADGLLADEMIAADLLKDRAAVLVQPVEAGLAAGFERIDLNHATAGAMRIPGRAVERLNELPADCDVVSALTRIALQSGVPQRALPDNVLSRGAWRLVRSDAEAQLIEGDWVAARLAGSGAETPTAFLARPFVRQFGPALLNAANGALSLHVAAGLCLMLAAVAGWFAIPALGFALIALGIFVSAAANMLRQLEVGVASGGGAARRSVLYGWIADALMVFVATWALRQAGWQASLIGAFAPVMLVLVSRLVATVAEPGPSAWIGDRIALAASLAVMALAKVLLPGMMVLAVGVMVLGLLASKPSSRLS